MNHSAKIAAQGPEILLASLEAPPIRPASQADARAALSALKAMAAPERQHLAEAVAAEGPLRAFLTAAFALSPYLRELAERDPDSLERALAGPLEARLETLILETRNAFRGTEDRDRDPTAKASAELPGEATVMTALRRAKREAALILGLADLARLMPAAAVTRWLSRFAEAATAAAVDHLLLAAAAAGKLTLRDPAAPAQGTGLIVLGMGKLGAQELNYSSDIDLVVFFDPAAGIVAEREEATEVFARLVRRLIRMLQERTADGYVFRTDLRLRPDPGSTPLAIPVEAALNYYAGRGQNWERAAFIKARPVAGDLAAGEAFLNELQPFVFRKYLDYAAIADIHSIKRQIHAHKGHGTIAVKGHNVKLGRGGIREIEFFVQTQQLIAGGRMPDFRARRSDDALAAMVAARWLDRETAERLTEAYWYLRDVEHRIQMVRDEQSHTLPEGEAELKRIALMMGEEDTATFSAALVSRLKTVETAYAELFERESRLSGDSGNLVFTGESDDPGTLETLVSLGFERPADISRIIRTWHYGRYRATRSVESRERLTELTPRLLEVFGATKRADEALMRFDAMIAGLPAGIQLFSLIGNNPGLLSLIVTIMSAAPRLADVIARNPHVFDGMLDPTVIAELPTRELIAERLDRFLRGASAHEEILDRLRIVSAEQKFLIGVRLLTGAISGVRAGRAFSDLADLILDRTLAAVMAEVKRVHGRIPGGRVALVGMGKLGSCELTAGSDIDMILLYRHDGDQESDGPKPLDPVRYYTRLTQRLIAALSAPTAEGILYEVDLRLRPSGNKGPVATSIAAFRKYQMEEAWTWEHMALTRARVVAGDAELASEAEAVFSAVRAKRRDEAAIARDVAEMRALIEKEKPPRDRWDFKLMPGGLIDIEFVAQFLALVAAASPRPAPTGTAQALSTYGDGRLRPEDAETLHRALGLYSEVSQLVRLCIEGPFVPGDAPAGLKDAICRAADMPDIAALEAEILTLSRTVRKICTAVLRHGSAG